MSRKKSVNPEDLLSEILASDFDLTRFRQIDESDIIQPNNFFEWVTGRDFCNTTILPWQVEQGMKLFSDYCPVCSNPKFLFDLFDQTVAEIQDNIVFLQDGLCPKCKLNRLQLFEPGNLHPTKPSLKNEYTACIGQRAGKSKSVALYTSYQLNRWLALPDPLQFYGDLPSMELILGTFSAITADQAEINLWMPFKGLYDHSPWFRQYNEFLKKEEKRLSIPLVEVKDTYIFYSHKRFLTNFTGSVDRTKRGATRLFAAIDEIAFLNSEANSGARKKSLDADKNYEAMANSLSTIRQKAFKKLMQGNYNVPMAIMHNASSPHNVQDKIMRLVKESAAAPWAQVIHKATWECNPDYTEKSCRDLNPGISQVDFDKNFGAIPPFSDSPYISEARSLEKLCSPKVQPLIVATPKIHTDQMGDQYLYLDANIPMPNKMIPRMLTLDNGYNQNAFGATVFRYDALEKKPVLEFAVSLYPQPDAHLSINFPMMFDNFIVKIIRNLRIEHVFYDRWQSLDQIHRLRDMKIDARAYSLNFEKDFLPFKQQLLSGHMMLPPCEMLMEDVKNASNPLAMTANNPIANLIWQALTVRVVGRKVLKPLQGDDDLFRAFVLGGSRFMDDEIKKKYDYLNGVGGGASGKVLGSSYGMSQGARASHPGMNGTNQGVMANLPMRVRTRSRR